MAADRIPKAEVPIPEAGGRIHPEEEVHSHPVVVVAAHIRPEALEADRSHPEE